MCFWGDSGEILLSESLRFCELAVDNAAPFAQGSDVTGCSPCRMNDSQCFANSEVASQPAGFIPSDAD
jgi:hypothetical protein